MSSLSIFEAASDEPERIGLVDADRSVTFAELAERAREAIGALERVGVSAAEPRPVALIAQPNAATITWLHALFAIGAPALLVHPSLTPSERARLIEPGVPVLDGSAPASAPGRAPPGLPNDERRAVVVWTSGSTGTPKRVELCRRALAAAAQASAAHLGWHDDDRWLACLPLAHVGGLSVIVRCLLARRAVVLAPAGDARALLEVCARERVTLASLVPTQLTRWIALERPLPSLRAVLVGGAAASSDLIARARKAGIPALATYGLSETCGQVATQRLSDPDTSSAGFVLPGIEVRLVSERIAIRGPSLASGLPLSEGFFVTDDLGRFDDAGRLVVLGRGGDRIITGGENVDPLEVEHVLDACAGVEKSCVFGVADPEWGERIAVAIVASPTYRREDLLNHAAKLLAPFKRPRLIAELESLCSTPTGKLDRASTKRAAEPHLVPLG